MYLTVLFLPLLGSLLANNRKTGLKGGPILSVLCLILATIFSVIMFNEVGIQGSTVIINLGDWVNQSSLKINWEFKYDTITVSMSLLVLLISSCVQLYSIEYLRNDPHLPRFFLYLSLFTFVMLLFITGENLFLLFMAWEAVGIISYLLVNYWFTGINNNLSALKA